MPEQPSKNIFKSKVFWVNLVLALIEVFSKTTGTELPIDDSTLGIIAGAANIGLRFSTDRPAHIPGMGTGSGSGIPNNRTTGRPNDYRS